MDLYGFLVLFAKPERLSAHKNLENRKKEMSQLCDLTAPRWHKVPVIWQIGAMQRKQEEGTMLLTTEPNFIPHLYTKLALQALPVH